MTLQVSGDMTIADINTELGRASDAQLSTDDVELLNMAGKNAGASITIPDDLYGKQHLGSLQGTYTVTVGDGGSAYGYQGSPSFGSMSPIAYRAAGISLLYSTNGAATEDVRLVMNGVRAADYVTAIYFEDEDEWYLLPSHATSSVTVFTFTKSGSGGPWDSGDIGLSKTVKIYGV